MIRDRSPEVSVVPRVDALDIRILRRLVEQPRIGVTELAARLGIARNTAHARAERLERDGVIGHRGREVDIGALGFELTAFVTLEVAQGRLREAAQALAAIPRVLEVLGITGQGDLLVRAAAPNGSQLHEVIDAILACPGVRRSTTSIVLTHQVPFRIGPLLEDEERRRARPDV
ncbi:Lrp/AsnC family transcriptional regulator [Actinomadura sp. PM05-2]|uniref:Lrp/AsnC family transcriptional regulator n=1 Tax=Actinomadura parmotrematis TaxID=2864039 RepID=A0ABS7FUC6_9ACTN|nr:Lrp/AsnC family transcriptional regulator [Actinomadura parmotrematis]